MAVGCGAKCAKVMLIVFNIIFWLSGCALLGVGIWLRVDKSILAVLHLTQVTADDKMLDYAAYLIIGIGAFVFLVGFLGCCGAIKENKCCLGLYIFFLLIVMAAELAAGILILVFKDQIVGGISDKLSEEVKKDVYVVKDDEGIKYTAIGLSMNAAQQQFKCCGIMNMSDYKDSNYTENAKEIPSLKFKEFPFTCCKMKADTSLLSEPSEENIEDPTKCISKSTDFYYDNGCQDALKSFVEEKSVILIGIGIGIACLEIFGFIFAVCLCRNTGDSDE